MLLKALFTSKKLDNNSRLFRILALLLLCCLFQLNLTQAFTQTLGGKVKQADTLSLDAQSNRWPKHAVRILVGFPPGSTPDMIARTIADPLSKSMGQPVIVENHVGVSGNLAAQLVARAQDDHTLGLLINGNLTTAKLLYPSLEFDPLRDFTPISLIADSPLVLVAPVNLPNGRAFFKEAIAEGNHWNYGSVGTGSMAHLAMEALKSATPGLVPVHIPYAGNPGVMNALIGGEIQMALVPIGVALPLIHSEKIQAIGLIDGRSILAPSVGALADLGIRSAANQLQVWDALVGPKSLSKDAQLRLSKEIKALRLNNELRSQLFNQGWIFRATTEEGLKNIINPEFALMQGLITKNKITINP